MVFILLLILGMTLRIDLAISLHADLHCCTADQHTVTQNSGVSGQSGFSGTEPQPQQSIRSLSSPVDQKKKKKAILQIFISLIGSLSKAAEIIVFRCCINL